MSQPILNRSEVLLRFSRRSMFATLILILTMGGLSIALAIWPDGAAGRFLTGAPWVLPIAIIFMAGILHSTLRSNRWDPKSPDVKAVVDDEWRRTNLDRAMRVTFVTVLLAQVPLGLALSLAVVPPLRALMAMAASTITFALALVATLFLIFDRDQIDE